MTTHDPDGHQIECICPDCPEDAEPGSEMCGGCEWLGCTDTRSKHS